MSQRDFIGTWLVSLTSGVPFGARVRIHIAEESTNLSIIFDPPVSSEALEARYDESLDMVEVSGIDGVESSLYLAVYLDPEFAYRVLYGVARVWSKPATFGAVADRTFTVTSPPPVDKPVFTPSSYFVRSTSGSQFGLASSLVFEPAGEAFDLTLTDPIGRVLTTPSFQWVSPTALQGGQMVETVRGEVRLVLQCSFVEIGNRTVCFGIDVAGDPENSGVWGADEEEPPPSGPDEIG